MNLDSYYVEPIRQAPAIAALPIRSRLGRHWDLEEGARQGPRFWFNHSRGREASLMQCTHAKRVL